MLISLISLAVEHVYPFWHNGFFYLSIGLLITFFIVVFIIMKTLKRKTADNKLMQQQHAAKIDGLRKDNSEKMEILRREMLNQEEKNSRLWHESEKETLEVLNGVSSLLELNEKLGQIETEKILGKLTEIQESIKEIDEIKNKLNNIITKE